MKLSDEEVAFPTPEDFQRIYVPKRQEEDVLKLIGEIKRVLMRGELKVFGHWSDPVVWGRVKNELVKFGWDFSRVEGNDDCMEHLCLRTSKGLSSL